MKVLVAILLMSLSNFAGATSLIIPGGASGNASSLRDDIASCTGGTYLKRDAGDTAWECGGSASAATDTIFDAVGDLLVATAADTATRLPKGTDGQVLSTDSTTATDLRWVTLPGGGDALVASGIAQFGTDSDTSAQLLDVISNETGSGVLVFNTSPTLVTPVLGVATATSINGNAFPADNSTLVSVDDTQILTGKTIDYSNNVVVADSVVSYTNMTGDLVCIDLNCDLASGVVATSSIGNAVGDDGGDMMMYQDGLGWTTIELGTAGQVLTVNGGASLPEWSNATATGDNVLVDSASTSNPDFVSTGDIDFVNTGNSITADVQANTVALGTDTTGGYAASSSEGGAATTATALAANGDNCSAGSAPIGVDASGAVEGCADVVTQVEGDLKAPLADPVFTSSLQIPNGMAPIVNAAGEVAQDTTANQLLYGATPSVLSPEYHECALITDTAAAADNRDVWMAPFGVTLTSVGCACEGTCTGTATFTLEDRGGNAMTITGTNPTCSTSGNSTYAAITAGGALVTGEKLNFDVTNTPNPETDEYLLCWTYTVDRQ